MATARRAFVGFAISFLEVGNPRLLRWIIQQREMYSGVLRGLGSDDTKTVVYVLSTLRDKVLSEHSLIPPGLRSVLFGSVTLEQLSYISGKSMAGPGADIAHEVLVLVCTDPSNGLMPGLNLKGNEKRLLELMKKLKATEVGHHRELLLAIVNKRPYLCSAYMDDFPYNLEPRPSSLWFAAISLAADMISSINANTAVMCLASHSNDLPTVNDYELQNVLKCIIPRACTRSVINKGLLHSDILVQHGSLRLILESLKSLGNLIKAIEDMIESMHVRKKIDASGEVIANFHGLPGFSCFVELNGCLGDESFSHMDEPGVEKHSKIPRKNLKRSADLPVVGVKKLKSNTPGENIDIVIGGIDAEPTNDTLDVQKEDSKQNVDVKKDHTTIIAELWGLDEQAKITDEPWDAEIFFHSKLLDALKLYLEKTVKSQAYVLARAAMISTGAFDQNFLEIDVWLFFLPGYNIRKYSVESQGAEMFHDLSAVVIAFLCDSVSTVGNNLYKYLDHMQKLISRLDDSKDDCPGFSPLVVCILQKCLRLLESDSETFRLYERSMIALYVCNTLSLLLQTQVDMKTLPGLINLVLTEKFIDHISVANDSKSSLCEWRPMKNLLCFARSILHQRSCSFFSISEGAPEGHGNSFFSVLGKIKEFLHQGNAGGLAGMAVAFSSSILCASPEDILKNFPFLLTISQQHFRSHIPFLSLVLFSEQKFLAKVSNLWPDMFISALEMIEGSDRHDCRSDNGHVIHSNESVLSVSRNHLDSKESAASAFCLFLRHAPFYALFSAFFSFESWKKHSTRMLDLLRAKIAEGTIDDLITYLRYALFWSYQMLSSYKAKPSDILEELFAICFPLVDYIFDCIVVLASDPAKFQTEEMSCITKYVQDVVDLIFHHPVVSLSVSHPLCCSWEHADDNLGDSEEAFLNSLKQNFHPMNNLMLQFLIKVFEFLLALEYQNSYATEVHDIFTESVLEDPKLLVQKVVLLFREKFDLCVEKRDLEPLIPIYNIFHAFMHFISPFELLELVFWMFSKLENEISGCTSVFKSAAILCLYIANGPLSMLCNLLQQPKLQSESHLFWDKKVKSFNTAILQRVFYKILDFAISFNLESADICLFSVVNAVYIQRVAKPHPTLLPLYMLLSRMIINSPMKLILHCLYPTSKIKAKALFRLVEVSPMHMRLFGKIFLGILGKDLTVLDVLNVDGASASWVKVTDMDCNYILSEDDFVLLLPAALSYFLSSLCKYKKQDIELFGSIPTFYFRILIVGFSNWKSYVSGSNFQEEYDEFSLTSMEDFHNLFNSSLLGKAITMLHYFFIINGNSIGKKQRLKIFDDIYSHLSDLLDCDFKVFNTCSYKESLKMINEISAKIALTRLLLFPP
ncbi:putative Nucleolar pre-ribosomal-associated protein 1 [Cocos nucifera]|uniref:Putative Nucleolar pre-ribosomal-associated protein 1 n=1 Tax=Cocos nucifera TaxID=13894 RepID=A0A8K0IX50_COCNU|nr:putative Nucleolar pre-ribosomal-associated protein 1 [Cocos nucifera]